MKKKTKKMLAPVILLVVLAALIAGYFILKSYNDKKATEAETDGNETEKIAVLDKSKATMTKLSIGDGDLKFSYVNDKWLWDGDERFPLDKEQLSEMEQTLNNVSAEAKVSEPGELSEYGLSEPSLTVDAEYSDGTLYTYKFGDVNDFNGYQYFAVTGDSNVYMLDQAVSEIFKTDIKSLFEKEDCALVSDSVQAEKVTSILIETAEKSNEITDGDGIKELFTPFYAMNLSSWEDYYADSEEMAKVYGIGEGSTKITLSYTVTETAADTDGNSTTVKVPRTYTVLLGNFFETDETDEDGNPVNGYFYTQEGSTVVYSVTEDKVNSVLEFLDYTPETEE